METEFSKLYKWIGDLRWRYANALSALRVYESLNKLSSREDVGEEAVHNVRAMNEFRYFFIPTKEACRCYFLINAYKFFDVGNDVLTLNKILNYAESNVKKLSKENFLKFHKDRQIIDELWKSYKEFTLSDVQEMRNKIDNKQEVISRLRSYRNQYLAHDDIKKKEVKIVIEEVQDILELVKDVLGIFYFKLDFASNTYKNFDEEPQKQAANLVNVLKKNKDKFLY